MTTSDSGSGERFGGGMDRLRILARRVTRPLFTQARRHVGIAGRSVAHGHWEGSRFVLDRVGRVSGSDSLSESTGETSVPRAFRDVGSEVAEELRSSSTAVHVALPSDTVQAGVFELPGVPGAEAGSALSLAMARSFPEIAKAEQSIDFESVDGNVDRYRASAVPTQTLVDWEESAWETAGSVRGVLDFETESAALGRLLPVDAEPEDRPVGILHVGERETVLALFRGGKLTARQRIAAGVSSWVDALTEPIRFGEREEIRLDQDQARDFLSTHALDTEEEVEVNGVTLSSGRVHSLARPSIERFLREVMKWIRHFQVSTLEPRPGRILVAGEGVEIAGLSPYLERYLLIPVAPLSMEVVDGACVDAGILEADEGGRALGRFAVAIGAAMAPPGGRGFVSPDRLRRERTGLVRRSVRYVAAASLAFMIVVALQSREVGRGLKAQADRARGGVAALDGSLSVLEERWILDERRAELERRWLDSDPVDAGWSSSLRDLASGLVDEAWIEELSVDRQGLRGRAVISMVVEGSRTDARRAIETFAAHLDTSPVFENPRYRVEDDGSSGPARIRFEVSLRLLPSSPTEGNPHGGVR